MSDHDFSEILSDSETDRRVMKEKKSEPNESCAGDRLKACPFCGGEVNFEKCEGMATGELRWSVGCGDEDCFGYHSLMTYPRQIDAENAWNRRVPEHGCNFRSEDHDFVDPEKLAAGGYATSQARLTLYELMNSRRPWAHSKNVYDWMEEIMDMAEFAFTGRKRPTHEEYREQEKTILRLTESLKEHPDWHGGACACEECRQDS